MKLNVLGFVSPDSEKGYAGALGHTPAKLERGANFQISPASAKIVSGFWLETNADPLSFRA
jgi:hypothetical protein